MTCDEVDRLLAPKIRKLADACAVVKELTSRLHSRKSELEEWQEAQRIIQEAGQAVQTAVHAKIALVVTRCLSAVFEGAYEFCIEFDRKRGRTEARLYFKRGGMEVDPIEASGLGVVDVASFALRLACLRLHHPPVEQVLVLDEPFRFVDRDNMKRVAKLIEQLAEETGVQFLITTHHPSLQIGEVIDLG